MRAISVAAVAAVAAVRFPRLIVIDAAATLGALV
jgi:hypothetical protein